MELFCSDLDNTLIYSYKRHIGNHKVLVEAIEEKELSFMSQKSHELLEKVKKKIEFIPVTTRSLEQYCRIQFDSKQKPKYALVANGGILLVDDKINKEWLQNSKRMIEPCEKTLKKGISLLEKDQYVNFQIRKVDELFVFTKSSEPEKTIEYLKQKLNLDLVSLHRNGAKVYIFPKVLNKGLALARIKAFLGSNFVVAAGDSDFDVPMLKEADLGLYPRELEGYRLPETCIPIKSHLFSEGLLQFLCDLNRKK